MQREPRENQIKQLKNYREREKTRDILSLERLENRKNQIKAQYKRFRATFEKIKGQDQGEKLKEIDNSIEEYIKKMQDQGRKELKIIAQNSEEIRKSLKIERLKDLLLSEKEIYLFEFYKDQREELARKYPDFIEVLKEILRGGEPTKQCFKCGDIKPISEYQRNGKTPKGSQKHRQECRECREERRESEKEARQDQAEKEKQRECEEVEALKIKEKRKREPKKKCKICGKKKPISEYQRNGKTPSGSQKHRQECRECRQVKAKRG